MGRNSNLAQIDEIQRAHEEDKAMWAAEVNQMESKIDASLAGGKLVDELQSLRSAYAQEEMECLSTNKHLDAEMHLLHAAYDEMSDLRLTNKRLGSPQPQQKNVHRKTLHPDDAQPSRRDLNT